MPKHRDKGIGLNGSVKTESLPCSLDTGEVASEKGVVALETGLCATAQFGEDTAVIACERQSAVQLIDG